MDLRLSLFDRLTDEHPQLTREFPVSPWEHERQLEAALCRDLSALLNTRRSEHEIPEEFPLLSKSVLAFGIPDFTSFTLTSRPDQERTRKAIEDTIRLFEPRLSNIAVTLKAPDPQQPLRPILEFQIDAVLKADPPEAIRFDAILRGDSRQFRVSGAEE